MRTLHRPIVESGHQTSKVQPSVSKGPSRSPSMPTYTVEDTDELLLERYRVSGDRRAFETLMRRYENEIYSYLRRYIGVAELAEDAFQGTFVQVHLKCEQFDTGRRFRPWLYAIATNQAIDVQRRNRRHRMVSLDAPTGGEMDSKPTSWGEKLAANSRDPLDSATDEENRRWVQGAVSSLGDSLERVVHLVYYQGLKYREAAEVLGIPVGTVKSRLHAAVQRLSTQWKDTHGDDDQ